MSDVSRYITVNFSFNMGSWDFKDDKTKLGIFKESALLANSLYKLKCLYVFVFVLFYP